METYFSEIKKNFGFGCMRLPMKNEKVDYDVFSQMIDRFIGAGFNYFDTARVYLEGQSETALRECLTRRYPRDAFLLADKLSGSCFEKEEDIRPFFESQLAACGVDYFDFYLLHAQGHRNYEKYKNARAYETAYALKKEGKIRHVGLSFHDSADYLDMILSEQPEVEFVQIQFNYLDYEDKGVQSRLCYDVCRKYNKPVIVMEPVKGGLLATLPEAAENALRASSSCSPAGVAIRFAAGFEGVAMVLSGMSDCAQMEDNLSFMEHFSPLSETEKQGIAEACRIIASTPLIQCTKCRYCVDGCPAGIPIPTVFSLLNRKRQFPRWNGREDYEWVTEEKGKASACISCGACEQSCPQQLPIRDLLKTAVAEWE